MAVNIVSASSHRIAWGDIAALGGISAITVAITIKFGDVGGGLIFHQWGTGGDAFMFSMASADELAFRIENSGTYGKQTTALNMAAGSTYRIVAKLNPASNVGAFWVNGANEAIAELFGSANVTVRDSSKAIEVGQSVGVGNSINGELSEAAIWTSYVPDWACEAISKGYSPDVYLPTRVFYAPLTNVSHLGDKHGLAGTNHNSTTDAAHPSMLYPRRAA